MRCFLGLYIRNAANGLLLRIDKEIHDHVPALLKMLCPRTKRDHFVPASTRAVCSVRRDFQDSSLGGCLQARMFRRLPNLRMMTYVSRSGFQSSSRLALKANSQETSSYQNSQTRDAWFGYLYLVRS